MVAILKTTHIQDRRNFVICDITFLFVFKLIFSEKETVRFLSRLSLQKSINLTCLARIWGVKLLQVCHA